MTQKRLRASSSDSPSPFIAARSPSATPMPAEPAPSMTICCSFKLFPVTLTAPKMAPRATADVPWISSLKVNNWSR